MTLSLLILTAVLGVAQAEVVADPTDCLKFIKEHDAIESAELKNFTDVLSAEGPVDEAQFDKAKSFVDDVENWAQNEKRQNCLVALNFEWIRKLKSRGHESELTTQSPEASERHVRLHDQANNERIMAWYRGKLAQVKVRQAEKTKIP